MPKHKMHSLGVDLHDRMQAYEAANASMKLDAAGNGKFEMDDATLRPVKPKPVKRLATPMQRVALQKATAVSAARRVKGPLAS